MLKNKRRKKKQLNKYLVLTSASFQIGITIYLGAYIGKFLDNKYIPEKKWFTIILVLLALIISTYHLTKQLKRINDE